MDPNNAAFWMLLAPSIGALIFAVAGFIKAQTAATLGVENKDSLEVVRKQFDGRLSQLMEKAELAQRALGVTEGQDKERGIQAGHLGMASIAARKVVSDALETAIQKLETEAGEARQLKAVAAVIAEEKLKEETRPVPIVEARRLDEH